MDNPNRDGRDEMNLAVLPIALLGRNDTRDTIQYYGTFHDGEKQQTMVWTVSGAANVGLPSEFAERVLVALLYIGAQNDYADRRMEFTPYQILTTLGHTINGRNYKAVETALAQLHGVSITSDNAWIEKKKDGSQKRVTTKRGFHIIDEYYLHYAEDEEDKEADSSFIVWGSRIWRNLQAGYIRRLDIDFYYSIDHPLARRLYRFLDKVMHYKPSAPYAIDVFDLANKLGLVQYEYVSQVKRLLASAADKLIESDYLTRYEFFKIGKYTRIRFYRYCPPLQMELFDNTDETNKPTADPDPIADLWAAIVAQLPDDRFPQKLAETRLLSIENGTATIAGGSFRDWIENRLGNRILKALQREREDITAVCFVE
jgi:plasmid replication initiation protein